MNKTPAVRFKGSTEEWEHCKLGELVRLNGRIGFRGYTQNDIISKDEGGILTFSPTNIINNQLILDVKNTYITQEKYDESPEIKIRNDDILFVKTGSTLGKSALVTGLTEPASINPQIVVMRTKPELRRYLSAQLTSVFIQKQVTVEKIGGAVPTLTETKIKNFDVFIPVDSKESTGIGDCFSNIDSLITFHQRKYEKLKNIKKSMLYKMFPQNGSKVPEIRFAGFTDEWEQRKLGKLAIFNPKAELPEIFEYVDLESVVGTEMISHRTESKITAPSRAQRLARTGDLFYQTVRPYQKNNYLFEKPDKHYVFSTGYAQMRPLVDGQFLLSLVQNENFVKMVLDNCTGTSYPAINSNDLADIEVLSPTEKEEQRIIGSFFKGIGNLITLHQRKLEKLKQLKQAMLHKMFV